MKVRTFDSSKWSAVKRIAKASLLAAIAVPFLELAFGMQLDARGFFTNLWASLIYSFSIGALMGFLMPIVWCASCRWNVATRWIARSLTIVANTAIGCLFSGLCLWPIFGPGYRYWRSFIGSLKIGLVISALAVAFLVMYERYRSQLQVTEARLKAKELERERALKLATEARLSSLESRLHPHFLFNTINSVSSLIHDDPKRAEKLLSQMADLLRFSLDSAHTGLVPLEREIKIVEDYLAIEKARFNGRLQYTIHLPADLRSIPVPPLAVQTLVENSVKYAVSPRRRGATIQVDASRKDGKLILQVSDDGPGFQALEIPTGHGLNNLEERLAALFGDAGKVHITSGADQTTVAIEMPLEIAKAA